MLIKKFLPFRSIVCLSPFFSTTPQPMQDWQYASRIHHHLKSKQLNKALSYLFDSYLNKKVLDIQTFNSIHHAIKQQKLDITYHQIAYKLYRQCFRPHLLMYSIRDFRAQWMQILLESKNEATLKVVKEDFEHLGLKMPQKQTKQKEKIQIKQVPKEEEENIINSFREVTNFDKNKFKNHKLEQEQIQNLIQNLLGNSSRVVLHNVEVKCENVIDDSQENDLEEEEEESYAYNEEEEANSDDDEVNELVDQITTVTQIKIGRIQIFDKTNKDDKKQQ